ncbi:MAG: histidine kinase [Variibacter sp.]|nr:histidine kinase [Variibacter sp.]
MAETAAMIGYDTTFEVSTDGGNTWEEIAEIFSITPPAQTIEVVDATHMKSPDRTREFIEGLMAPGEFSFEMNFVPGSAADAKIRSLRGAGKVDCRITFPNGVTWSFKGIRTTYEPAVPAEDKMTATVGFQVTGSVIAAASAAPVNSVLPAISGIAQVGQTLTAYPGVWSGAPTFTYQWQEDAGAGFVAIAGATSKTYVPQAGQVGRPLRVVVTATNPSGSASANSAPTADVVA